VPGDRDQIDAQFVDIHTQFSERLGRVGMHQSAALLRKLRNLPDGLQSPDLVIRVHDADDSCAALQRLLDLIGINQALAVDGNLRHFAAQAFQESAWLERCRVLDGAGNDVRPARPAAEETL
jgi:hypothetical protein